MVELDADHAPFLSMPGELVAALDRFTCDAAETAGR
jgi:TRAP-type mannitol/chloroaromatic compound transport system substrate-binding protein